MPCFMTLAQADQILDRGDNSCPRCCALSRKTGPESVKLAVSDMIKCKPKLYNMFDNMREICKRLKNSLSTKYSYET